MNRRPEPLDRLRPILVELDDAYDHVDSALAALRDLRLALAELYPELVDQDEGPRGDGAQP